MFNNINGTAVRWDLRNFMGEMGVNSRMALKVMSDVLANPPHGFSITEVEGPRFTLEIRRLKDAVQ